MPERTSSSERDAASGQRAAPQERTFAMDAGAERATATLRLVAAVVVAGATLALALMRPGLVLWTIIALAWIAVVFWLVASTRSRRRATDAGRYYLALRSEVLELAEGDRVTRVPWAEVSAVEVDEDKLVVRVERGREPALLVEPRYAGVTIYELRDAIANALAARPGAP